MEKLTVIVEGIVRRNFFASDYDEDIQIIKDYFSFLQMLTNQEIILYFGGPDIELLTDIAKGNPAFKIYFVTDKEDITITGFNIVKYGSREHKLLSLLAERVYACEDNIEYAFPFDFVTYKEFNELYSGLLRSRIIKYKEEGALI